MSQRLKGQETQLSFTDSNGSDETIGDVQSFEAELDIEILQEGYLGETSDRYDDIFHGVSGSCELHIENTRFFKFTELIESRSKRRTPASATFNALSTFQFPNGEKARISFEDIFFGGIPIRAPGRADYVSVSLSWKCSNITRLL